MPRSAMLIAACAGLAASVSPTQAWSQTTTPPAIYTDKFITVNGLRLHYLDWGNETKAPFIMLHGISRIAHQFDHLAPYFKDDYHVIAIDMRGHGDSDWSPEGAYIVEDYVQDLEAFVDRLNLRRLTLLGNSTGGRVVQVYAGLHPERVARLISEDVGPERTNEIASAFTRQVQQEQDGWASEDDLLASLKKSNPKTPEEILRSYAHFGSKRVEARPGPARPPQSPGIQKDSAEPDSVVRADLKDDRRIVWKRDPNLAKGFVPTELWRFVSKITCPAIYILGGASRIVPPETQQKLKETIPNVQIAIIAGAGHYPDQEATMEFLQIVQTFLKGAPVK